jgi:hypothetical protein
MSVPTYSCGRPRDRQRSLSGSVPVVALGDATRTRPAFERGFFRAWSVPARNPRPRSPSEDSLLRGGQVSPHPQAPPVRGLATSPDLCGSPVTSADNRTGSSEFAAPCLTRHVFQGYFTLAGAGWMQQGSERDKSYFAPSSAFGASDRLSCPACSGTMTISRRTPVDNLPNFELQTFSCHQCGNDWNRTVDQNRKPPT